MENSFADVRVFACHVLSEEIKAILPPAVSCEFLDYKRHNTPDLLRKELQELIDNESGAKTILLGYGLCSQGTAGLKSRNHRLVIPRVHDCIALLLGSHAQYIEKFNENPATYYLSPGWIEHGGSPLQEYEDYVRRYGEAKAKMVSEMMYQHYKRLTFVDTGVGNRRECLEHCAQVADKFQMELLQVQGSNRLLTKLLQPEMPCGELVFIQPGEEISMNHFAAIMGVMRK